MIYSTDQTQPNRKRTQHVRSESARADPERTQGEPRFDPERTLEANADIY
jgi:hypothetical protein